MQSAPVTAMAFATSTVPVEVMMKFSHQIEAAVMVLVEAVAEKGKGGEAALNSLTRLAALWCVASRYVNDKGKADRLWTPGENR